MTKEHLGATVWVNCAGCVCLDGPRSVYDGAHQQAAGDQWDAGAQEGKWAAIMSEQANQDLAIILDEAGEPTHAVPRAVLEALCATPDQRATIEAALHDTEGYRLAPDEPIYLPTAEALAPYRLSAAQRAALGATEVATDTDDVYGHEQYIGQFPSLVRVEPPPGGIAAYVAFGRPSLWVSPMQARDPFWNRNAGYYPKLN